MEIEYVKKGDVAEKNFVEMWVKKQPQAIIRTTTEDENIVKHWDFVVNGVSVDVKSIRTYQRYNDDGTKGTNYTTVEYLNKQGNIGSLFGACDWFAFQSGTSANYCYLLVKRAEVQQFCANNVRMETRTNMMRNYLYSSMGKDLIAVLDMDCLKEHCSSAFILK